jgi:hypothetical protein
MRAGYVRGQHFTDYVETVKTLKRTGSLEEVERLLLELINATEAENCRQKMGVAPWYYEEVAKLYRKRKDYGREVAILERFAEQKHAPSASPPRLLNHLEKAIVLFQQSQK